MLYRAVTLLLVATAVGCGGATAPHGDGGTGGNGDTGGNASVSSGGARSNISSGVSNTTGAIIDCIVPECPDGEYVVPPGEVCAVCSCSLTECEPLNCPPEWTRTPPGACCPQCADSGCEALVCEGPTECYDGYVFSRPDGACCGACVPGPDGPACLEQACAAELDCPLGFTRGDLAGGCCYECLPDPLYCEDAGDCVLADRPRSCCGCPEVISTRALDDDPCWSPVGMPRDIPDECYPAVICDAFCGACPNVGEVVCRNNRCQEDSLR